MSDSPVHKFDSVIAVSPEVKCAGQALSLSESNQIVKAMTPSKTMNSALLDGNNPLSINTANDTLKDMPNKNSGYLLLASASDGGVRAPSSFAQEIERRLRESADGRIDTSGSSVKTQAAETKAETISAKENTPAPIQQRSSLPAMSQSHRDVTIQFHPVRENKPVVTDETSKLTQRELSDERNKALSDNENRNVNSVLGMKKAEALAKKLGVPLVVDFGFPGCPHCVRMEKETYPQFESRHKPAVIAHVNIQRVSDGGASIFNHLGIQPQSGYPQTYVFAPNPNNGDLKRVWSPQAGFIPYSYLSKHIPIPLPLNTVLKIRKKG